ncbi:MAG: hemerythrin domain-containing protein [Deltaproteobacteria bacterium]|nr:hemerythrin domain-containing protein [Deltaproteobacteria bacterium]
MFQEEGLIPFFQHAHHRVEGWLLDFQEGLEKGQVQPELFRQATGALLDHMYVEEELLFPMVAEGLATAIANLREEHGHIWGLVDEIRALLGGTFEERGLRALTTRLVHLLAAHSAAEDLGIYPDLVAHLGPAMAHTLLTEAERSRAPDGWVCAARRSQSQEAG